VKKYNNEFTIFKIYLSIRLCMSSSQFTCTSRSIDPYVEPNHHDSIAARLSRLRCLQSARLHSMRRRPRTTAAPLRRRPRTTAALPSGQPYPFSLLAECYGAALAASSFGHLLLVSFQVFSFVHLVLVRYLKF
jgi:hypothetical protein